MADVLQQCFDRILRAYLGAREEGTIEPQHPVAADFEELRLILAQHIQLAAHDDIQARWSVGRGHWAKIPWLGFFDERETTSAQHGVYIVYLFREDMSGVYVCLVHGVQKIFDAHRTNDAQKRLQKIIAPIRTQVTWLSQSGFELRHPIDLKSNSRLARAYEHGVFAHKFYPAEHLPNDAQIIQDFDDLLDAYEGYVTGAPNQPMQHWVFFDEQVASQEHQVKLRAKDPLPLVGDAVYLWQERTQGWALLAQTRIDVVKQDTESRRVVTIGVQPYEQWVDPIEVHDLGADFSLTVAQFPTSTYRLKPMSFEWSHCVGLVVHERATVFDFEQETQRLIDHLHQQGWSYEPWLVAAYLTALRTKPFVILAGVSGVGKSRLPSLVAEATGAYASRLAVRPDWTDSSDVLGYMDLTSHWRPGAVLRLAQYATEDHQRMHVCVLDEMNLAHVEHYFAEVLSAMEDRRPFEHGGWRSQPLLGRSDALDVKGRDWSAVCLPPNFACVGTINMDESTHSLSRKVLDRAFTLELSDVDLRQWSTASPHPPMRSRSWPVDLWVPRATRLNELSLLDAHERAMIDQVISQLHALNGILKTIQLQIGYRTRDEIALFVLHAEAIRSAFVTKEGQVVSSLDIGVATKILPRLVGGSVALRDTLACLMHWAFEAQVSLPAQHVVDRWVGRWQSEMSPSMVSQAAYPYCASRLCVMWVRLMQEGFTSYWS